MNRLYYLLAGGCLALCLNLGPARAETVFWADNFDTNAAAHWTASGPWHIGSPTAGPPTNTVGERTHSGADCASTQKYGDNQDGRLICVNYNGASSLVVPAANLYPRLRFWQWFNYANALGYVEISTNAGSTWNQLSDSYLDVNSSGVWSRPYFDLTGYAGLSVRLAFHFTSGGCCGNGLGWFVDDVEVVTGSPWMTLPEGFEFDPKTTDWSVDAGTWEIGRPTSGPGAAYTGTNCAATVLAGNYGNNVDSRLISPPFVVPPSNSPSLRFWQWYDFQNALGYVEINNGSITITTVTNITITTNVIASSLDTNIYEFFGSTNDNYSTPFYWNATIGGWTNSTRTVGSVYFFYSFGQYLFSAGFPPLADMGSVSGAVDYTSTNEPSPDTANPTNFMVWQGMTWVPEYGSDYPIGYFSTNFTYTYTTNTTVTTGTSAWTQLSPTYEDSASGWTSASVDLSAYEGQAVRVAFHFTSGGEYTEPGWYVDDLSLGVPPELTVPTNQTLYAGDKLMVTSTVANLYVPNAVYTFALVSPPAHMTINSNGVITWQTTTNQAASTNTITVVASDNSLPPLSATNSFVVTVINEWIPTLIVPSAQSIYAGATLTVTLEATNDYYPDDSYTYAVLSSSITNLDTSDLTNDGVLAWPTLTDQKAGTYKITVKATDDNPPNLSATNSFEVTVQTPAAPVLTMPTNRTLNAGQTLTAKVTATNSTFPDSKYTYAVTNSPAGVSIAANTGVLTWVTTATNKSEKVTIYVVAEDDHTPPLSATGNFTVTVAVTPRPTLTVPTVVTNYSGRQIAIGVSATNTWEPAATYTFSLLSVSTNLFITNSGSASAVLTWTNTGIQDGVLTWTNNSVAPRTNTIYVRAQDNHDGAWTNSVTNHFSLVFLPPQRPYLEAPTNGAVYVGETAANDLVATNWMVPSASYTYALVPVQTNGILATNSFVWTNVVARPGTYAVRIKLTDNSVPPLLATNDFFMTVLPLPSQLALSGASVSAGGAHTFRFTITTPWTNSPWRIEAATNVSAEEAAWVPVYTNLGGSSSLIFTDRFTTNFPQRYYRAIFP